MRRYTGCPCSLHLAFYVLLRAANADLRRPGSQRAREDVGAAFPCASTYYNGRQRIEKTRFAAGARGRVAYVAGLEHTGHHLWHDGVFKQPGPWRNAYDDVRRRRPRHDLRRRREARKGPPRGPGAYAGRRPAAPPQLLLPVRDRPGDLGPGPALVGRGDGGRGLRLPRHFRDTAAGATSCAEAPTNGFTAGRIATLTRSCRRLEAQLRRLDPRFLVCAPYPDAYANATKLSRFLGVDVRSAVAASFRPSKRDDAGALARVAGRAGGLRAPRGLLAGAGRGL